MSDENLPVPVAETPSWKPLQDAPRDRPVLLFCPWVDSPDGTGAHPDAKVAHARVVGWWSEKFAHWASALPGGEEQRVYPSRFADLLDEPRKG